jgi:hypothetical protein
MKTASILLMILMAPIQVWAADSGQNALYGISQINQTDKTNQIDHSYLGNLSADPFLPDSTANPFDKGSPFAPNGINNPFSPYGSPYSSRSATNPFATEASRLNPQCS